MAASSDGKVSSSSFQRKENEILEHKLWIGNLDRRLSEFNLLKILQRFGAIKSFDFLFHKTGIKEGEPRGYCFVEFTTRKEAEKALQGLNGKMALSKPLMVDWAKKKNAFVENNKKLEDMSSGSPRNSFHNFDSKINAIEAKLKLMESGEEKQSSFTGKHPLLIQSDKLRTHPYKKQERRTQGKRKQTR